MADVERRVDPYSPGNAEKTKKIVLEYLDTRQKVKQLLDPYKSNVGVVVDESEFPLKIVHTGDTHLGHVESKISALSNAVAQTGKDGLLVTHANLMDNVSNKFTSTNTINVGLNSDEQADLTREIVSPVDKRKHLIVFGANTCHEGWSYKTSTHDVTRDLVSPETPMLYNGGQIVLTDKNGNEIGRVEGYHNSGKGRTKWSPEGSVRERVREVPFGDPERPNVVIDAHMHQLTVAQDVVRSPVDRRDHITVLGEVGASKGSEESPDRFINALGVPPRNQPIDAGEGLVVVWKKTKSGKVSPYPVADYDRAKIVYDAEKLYEDALRTGTYRELYEEMMASGKFEKPDTVINDGDSLTRHQDLAVKSEGQAPLYKTVAYDIKTNLPVRVHFMGNLRVGSSSFERETFKSHMKNINGDPWAYYFATRRLINQSSAKSIDRKMGIQDLGDLLGLASTSALGIMLTDELRSSSWTRDIKKGSDVVSKGFFPGDYLYYDSAVKGVPLIMPETVSFLNLKSRNKKEVPYTLYIRDKLSYFTSLINPYHGLTRIEGIWGVDADLLVGGHTEAVGWRTWMKPRKQLEVVVPGGYAEYTEKGVSNRVDYPSGGQGSIFFPDEKRVYSFATFEEGRDMHEAFVLTEGLKKLGTLPQIRKKLQKQK